MKIRLTLALATITALTVACNDRRATDVPSAPSTAEQVVEIPAEDQVDNTAQVEAEAAAAPAPTQEQIDQYNKDEAAMDDLSKARAEEAAKK